jgi:hypothetical protein
MWHRPHSFAGGDGQRCRYRCDVERRCVMFFTPEYSFRKLSAIVMHFSRTAFCGDATDGRWVGNTETQPAPRHNVQGASLKGMTTMLRKITLAFVAAASLSVTALAPTAASAGGFWHPHHHWGHGHGFGIGFVDGGYSSCYRTRMVLTPFGYRLRTINVCAF